MLNECLNNAEPIRYHDMLKYTLLFSLIFLIGCFSQNSSESTAVHSEITNSSTSTNENVIHKDSFKGIKLSLNQSEYSISKNDTVKYTISNTDFYQVQTGYSFTIDRWIDNSWSKVKLIHDGHVDVAFMIHENDEKTFNINLFRVQNYSMEKGKYRIVKSLDVYLDEKLKGQEFIFAEFYVVE